MKKTSPLTQLTVALVGLTLSLILMAQMLLGAVPGQHEMQQRERARLAQALAVQIAELLRHDDRAAIEATLRGVASRVDGVASVGVRRVPEGSGADAGAHDVSRGVLVADSGGHAERWRAAAGRAGGDHLTVPLAAAGRKWGTVEFAFEPDTRGMLARWWDEPLVRLFGFIALAGALAYGLYMRRALQHLDPASVIPDRVQHAFDAMAEGVAVLDARGRVLLTNRAFRSLHPEGAEVRTGQPLSALPWLGAGLAEDAASHPWHRAMALRGNTSGDALEIGRDIERVRHLVVNCAPITDAGGAVRGCLATFDDLTELHHANAALQRAMAEAHAAKEEVQQKNAELLRLATRDPLTGCLNRRALFEALAPMFAAAQRERRPLGCLVLDIDHFKKVNDSHGHGVGDRVIQEVAKKLLESARSTDLVCRYGGEEFVVIVPGLQPAEMLAFGERVRARIEAECGRGVREVPGMVVTASLGCDAAGETAASVQAMIERADQALYAAKQGGRNRVASVAGAARAVGVAGVSAVALVT
jgi:diguanylate cyclase (GGDEF)-like protein